VNERTCRIIAHAVVEYTRNDINLFRSRIVNIELVPACAGIEFNNLSQRAVRSSPESLQPNDAKLLFTSAFSGPAHSISP
jgi:hypothetical protein